MKKAIVTAIMAVGFMGLASAQCTVTTDCGERTYQETSVSASVSNGVVTVSSNGGVIDSFTCEGANSVSTSCSSGSGSGSGSGGSSNFCDFIPDFLKPFFGCE